MRALRVRPFSLEGLPRLPRVAVPWTRMVARARAGLPAEIAATLRGLGPVSVRPFWLSFLADGERAGEAFSLEARGHRGRLVVDSPLAVQLVAAAMGAPPPTAVRALGRAERGALAAVVVTFLEAAGVAGTVRVGLDAAGPLAPGEALAVDLEVRAAAGSGSACLELPAALLLSAPGPAFLDASKLAATVALELARTTVPAVDLAEAQPGDAVLFEGCPPASAELVWPLQVRFGDCSLFAELAPDGKLQGRGPLSRDQAANESEASMSSDNKGETTAIPALSPEAARALAAAPIEIVAEVGRLTLRGEELIGLIEGGVLSLGPRRPAQVSLRVAGQLWATGELVAIDDELGVRITSLARG